MIPFNLLNIKNYANDKFKLDALFEWVNRTVAWQNPNILKDGTTVTWNINDGYNAQITLAGSRTLQVAGAKLGTYGTIKIIQGGSGSYTLTLPSGSKVANAGAGVLTLSTTVGSIDIASFYFDGTNYFWTLSTDFT